MVEDAFAGALAFGVLGVALFCAGRLVLGALWRRPVEHDVDIAHVVMGVSMAGMLTGWLAGSWTDAWVVAFTASTCWFAWRTRSDGGHIRHLVASVAMLYMLAAVAWLGPASPGHSMGAAMGSMVAIESGTGTPTLALAVACLLVLDASIAATRAFKPAAFAIGGEPCAGAPVTREETEGRGSAPLAPRGTAVCTLVMTLAMAYMFVTMHP